MCECARDGIRNVLVGAMRPTPSADGAAQTFPNVLYTCKDDILKAVYWYLHVNLISRTNDDHYHSGLMPSADGCYVC